MESGVRGERKSEREREKGRDEIESAGEGRNGASLTGTASCLGIRLSTFDYFLHSLTNRVLLAP